MIYRILRALPLVLALSLPFPGHLNGLASAEDDKSIVALKKAVLLLANPSVAHQLRVEVLLGNGKRKISKKIKPCQVEEVKVSARDLKHSQSATIRSIFKGYEQGEAETIELTQARVLWEAKPPEAALGEKERDAFFRSLRGIHANKSGGDLSEQKITVVNPRANDIMMLNHEDVVSQDIGPGKIGIITIKKGTLWKYDGVLLEARFLSAKGHCLSVMQPIMALIPPAPLGYWAPEDPEPGLDQKDFFRKARGKWGKRGRRTVANVEVKNLDTSGSGAVSSNPLIVAFEGKRHNGSQVKITDPNLFLYGKDPVLRGTYFTGPGNNSNPGYTKLTEFRVPGAIVIKPATRRSRRASKWDWAVGSASGGNYIEHPVFTGPGDDSVGVLRDGGSKSKDPQMSRVRVENRSRFSVRFMGSEHKKFIQPGEDCDLDFSTAMLHWGGTIPTVKVLHCWLFDGDTPVCCYRLYYVPSSDKTVVITVKDPPGKN